MNIDRRSLLKYAALAPFVNAVTARAAEEVANAKADYTLRIGTGLVELAPMHIVATTLYNGQFPGPLLRFKEGQRVVVDIHNDTDTPELVHWHGQMIPSDVDGAAEEGTPFVPAHGMRRISFVPKPSGFRFYHTHVVAGGDLNRGTYTGQAGPVYIEPQHNPGAYDREVFLVMKEFAPTLSRGGDMAMDALAGAPIQGLQQMGQAADQEAKEKTKGFEVGYELFAINGRMLGHGEPIRVRQGERVLFHVLNASATEIRSLALPGAGQKGKPQWVKPTPFHWDYTRFGKTTVGPALPAETIEITILKHNAALNGFNQWTLNGEAFSMQTMKPRYTVHQGGRYRLRFRNASDDIHPLHLHRHSFELTRIAGKPTAGVIKDVVMLGGFQELEFEFVADNPGTTLFHCHQQLHMDFGLMALFDYA